MKIHPLQINQLQKKNYPGGNLKIEQRLDNPTTSDVFIVSYPSEGLKIYGLVAIPAGSPPAGGWPLIVFNRGFVPKEDYKIDKQYQRYWQYLVNAGFAIFKSDYRGIGRSQGEQAQNLIPSNSTDVLNGLLSLKNWPKDKIDFNQVGIWGHSMGAQVSLQCMLSSNIFKAGVLWSGFFIPVDQMIKRWRKSDDPKRKEQAEKLIKEFGDPNQNSDFYHSISPIYHLNELPGPIQLHHGQKDDKVPYTDSLRLEKELKKAGKSGGIYIYKNGGHNLNEPDILPEAMANTIEFFNEYLAS